MMQRFTLLALLALQSAQAHQQKTYASIEIDSSSSSSFLRGDANQQQQRSLAYQHRELTWSWWSSMLNHIDHAIHPDCPIHVDTHECVHGPGHLGPVGPRCKCDYERIHVEHKKKKSHSSSSSNTSSSTSTSTTTTTNINYNFNSNIRCVDSDGNTVDCTSIIICVDDNGQEIDCAPCTDDNTSGQPCNPENIEGWQDDGHSVTDDATATDDKTQPVPEDDAWMDDGYTEPTPTDDAWRNDGWQQNNLSGQSMAAGNNSVPVWPFIVGAMVAGVIGAAFVVSRRKRRIEVDNHPLEGSVKKRMGVFGVFSRGNNNKDGNNSKSKPAFIEISEKKNKSYKAPSSSSGMKNSPNLMDNDEVSEDSSSYARQL